jgi:hypothetical protein
MSKIEIEQQQQQQQQQQQHIQHEHSQPQIIRLCTKIIAVLKKINPFSTIEPENDSQTDLTGSDMISQTNIDTRQFPELDNEDSLKAAKFESAKIQKAKPNIVDPDVEKDIHIQMQPRKEWTKKVKVKSIERATPLIIEPDDF